MVKSFLYIATASAALIVPQNIAKKHLKEDEIIYLIVDDKETQYSEVQAFAQDKRKAEVILLDIEGKALAAND